jgi:ribosomal protein S18 acetylase RimI-like enzyme
MGLTIRPFDDRDEAAVVALWRAAFPSEPTRNEPLAVIRQKRAVQPELFLVGEAQGRIVATVIAGYDGHRGWVYHVAVASDARRRGYGRALMAAAEERLRALGCPKINLQVNRWNAEVVAFYEALGYAVEDRISMGKPLPGARRPQATDGLTEWSSD